MLHMGTEIEGSTRDCGDSTDEAAHQSDLTKARGAPCRPCPCVLGIRSLPDARLDELLPWTCAAAHDTQRAATAVTHKHCVTRVRRGDLILIYARSCQ